MSRKTCFVWVFVTWLAVLASAFCIYMSLFNSGDVEHHGLDHRYFCALILAISAIYQRLYCDKGRTLPVMMRLAVFYACAGMAYGLYELYNLI